ncbi:MAG: exodeoxyribonuclease VII large subunit [Dissulfurispiraceae bacterium]
MERQTISKSTYSLYELNTIIKSVISDAFAGTFWVIAEIAECRCNQRGHCYLELVEKEADKTIAQIRATIWAYDYRRLSHNFQMATSESLKQGMKILLLAGITFHEVYGLSLNIRDIDPTYTMGEMARRKAEVIERLKEEGLMDLNKGCSLPLVPQRIAVISSPTAAGYGDFFDQLDKNLYGYIFDHVLFPALMQGQEAEESIISALTTIGEQKHRFDVVVLVRGGGSVLDLNCFDGYAIASHIARCPLPVITGIGHEKDASVADMVAHTRMKTPTAVAEFLISGIRSFEERIIEIHNLLKLYAERLFKDQKYKLNAVTQRLAFLPSRMASTMSNKLLIFEGDIKGFARQFIQKEDNTLNKMEQAVRLLNPATIIKRGYSITRCEGRVLKNVTRLRKGAILDTRLCNGSVTSVIDHTKEGNNSE